MIIEKFVKIFLKDSEPSKLQNNIEKFVLQFYKNPFLKGVIFKSTTISTSSTEIIHNLGFIPNGYLILDKDANAVIWKVSSDNKTITLQSDSSVSATVWVF